MEKQDPSVRSVTASRLSPRWIFLVAVLLACIYLPSLRMRFDFIDDGNLVYPEGQITLSERFDRVCQKIQANYEHLGPFRPVLWVHWTIFAEINQGSEIGWRLTRFIWCVLAGAMMLWLLRDLGIAPAACAITAAIAIWNPYRSEIWTSNTLGEGVAMPYALFALVAARRAARSSRPWLWDMAGMLAVLAALGCKNTFAALIPAQIFLRLAIDGVPLRECWKMHRSRALLLGLTLIAPAIHFIYFKMHWQPGQYKTNGPTFAQFQRIIAGYQGGISLDFLAAGLVGIAFLILFAKRKERDRFRWNVAAKTTAVDLWNGHRAAIGSGLLLIGAGIVIYLPMGAMSGRYVMPGIWGLDILIGIVLSHFILIPGSLPKRAAWAALSIGMIAVASANIGKQETQIARTRMLWDALEWVEGNAPRDTTIGWFGGIDPQSTLSAEEGVHFAWHLRARSKAHVRVILFDERGIPWDRVEIQDRSDVLDLRIVGMARAIRDSSWQEQSRFIETYWAGWKKHECVVERPGRDAPVTALDNRHVSAGR